MLRLDPLLAYYAHQGHIHWGPLLCAPCVPSGNSRIWLDRVRATSAKLALTRPLMEALSALHVHMIFRPKKNSCFISKIAVAASVPTRRWSRPYLAVTRQRKKLCF